eukprot:SAG11_NODE_818_length_7018_cov_10.501373_6_plen_57_part_00
MAISTENKTLRLELDSMRRINAGPFDAATAVEIRRDCVLELACLQLTHYLTLTCKL